MVDDIREIKPRQVSDINQNSNEETKDEVPEPAFVPPERIAADEDTTNNKIEEKTQDNKMPANKRPSLISKLNDRLKRLSKKQWLLIFALLIAVGVGAYDGYVHFVKPKIQHETESKNVYVKPKPKTEASKLTGVQVSPDINQLPVTGVMIENSPDARPQSGLKDAGIIFEAIAEGGITRFLTLFLDNQPTNIGPVRSARPYYLQWLLGFDAGLAHVGGSPDALGQIKSLGVRDLDEFANAGTYHRITQRVAPHNVYTGVDKLLSLEKSKGYTNSTFTSLSRKADQPLPTPTASSIDLNISSSFYNAHFDYDKTTNSYKRSEGGSPQIDANSNQQLEPKVVVVLVMGQGIASDGQHTTYNSLGSGQAYFFQDGFEETGTWQKNDPKTQFSLTNASGKTEKLNVGQTWFVIVGDSSRVSFK